MPLDQRFPGQSIPMSLNAVAIQAMKVNQVERYASVEELKVEVQNYLSGYSTLAENAGFWTELKLFYKRNQKICLSVAITLSLIVLGTFFFIEQLNESRQRAEAAYKQSETDKALVIQEKERVEQEKERANQETARANELLKQYELERGFGDVLINDRFSFLKDLLRVYSDRQAFEDPKTGFEKSINALNVIVKNKQANKWALNQRGYIYFLSQEFTKAVKDFEGNALADKNLVQLAKKYAGKYIPGEVLQLGDMKSLLTSLYKQDKNHHAQILLLIRYDQLKRQNDEEKIELVKHLLKLFNPGWNKSGFSLKDGVLTLGGKELKTITANRKNFNFEKGFRGNKFYSLLKNLDFQKLDIRLTGITDLVQLNNLSIHSADIRGLKISSLKRFKNSELKELTLERGQFSDNQISVYLPDIILKYL